MSGLLFPSLAGQQFTLARTPVWKTLKQEALSGKQSTLALRMFAMTHFELAFDLLRDNVSPSEIKAIVGLHAQVQGSFDTFRFTDPDFNAVDQQQFGQGNGSQTVFQLVATYENSGGPGYAELIQNLNGARDDAELFRIIGGQYLDGARATIHADPRWQALSEKDRATMEQEVLGQVEVLVKKVAAGNA